jgi:deoxyribodipyrimidine photolyase-related protein
VVQSGYARHVERLMALSNFLMLIGVDSQVANEWFLSIFVDACEWVMPHNAICMVFHKDGDLTANQSYLSSANYINRMSDCYNTWRFKARKCLGEQACL